MSRDCREGREKIQSHGLLSGVDPAERVVESCFVLLGQADGGRPFVWFEDAVVVGRISWASLKPVRVDAKTDVDVPDGL
jgi:hypothetical protein